MIKDKTHGKVPYITLVIVPPNVLVMGADVFFHGSSTLQAPLPLLCNRQRPVRVQFASDF